MAYKPIKLADSVRQECNRCLEDLQGLQTDIQRADRARIQGMDGLLDRCQNCIEKIQAIKSEYFPNKK